MGKSLGWAWLAACTMVCAPRVASSDTGDEAPLVVPFASTASETGDIAVASSLDLHAKAISLLLERKSHAALDWLAKRAASTPMSVAELAQHWRLNGVAWGRLGQGAEAQNAFSIALRIEPAFRLDTCPHAATDAAGAAPPPSSDCDGRLGPQLFREAASDPEIRSPFQAALAGLPAANLALAVRFQLKNEPDGTWFSLREVVDDMKLVHRLEIRGKSKTWEEIPDAVLPPLRLRPEEGPWTLRVLDAQGHLLWTRDLPVSALNVQASTPRDFHGFAIVGAATLASGALLTLGANAASAFLPAGGAKDAGTDGFVSGAMWTGTALVGLGGALVLYDLIRTEADPSPP